MGFGRRADGCGSGICIKVGSHTPYWRCQIFRNEKDNANDDVEADLRLQLKDFATEALVGSDELDDLICIPDHTLCSYVDEAEQNMAKLRQNQCHAN